MRLGHQLSYRGVGTVEFIVSGDSYYFLEVNPRLQVEHPVTEMVTGIDIVELMLRIAAGEGLPLTQQDIECRATLSRRGSARRTRRTIFCRRTGRLSACSFPTGGVRVETGVESGSVVTPYYNSMLAKLIARGRNARRRRLTGSTSALAETSIFGLTTNLDFLRRLIALPATREATFYTRLIDDQLGELADAGGGAAAEALAVGACFWLMQQRQPASRDPWQWRGMTGWHMGAGGDGLSPIPILHLEARGASAEIRFAPQQADGTMLVGVNDAHSRQLCRCATIDSPPSWMAARRRCGFSSGTRHLRPRDGAATHTFAAIPYLSYVSAPRETSGELRAPMTGMVIKVNVAVGDAVKAGDVVASWNR